MNKVIAFGALAVTVSIALLGLVVWIVRSQSSGSPWDMVQGISAVVAIASIVGSGTFALFQYATAQQNRHLAIYNEVFTRLMSNEQVEARRWIYQHVRLPTDAAPGSHTNAIVNQHAASFLSALDQPGQQAIKNVLNAFDHLGFLVRRGWLNDPAVLGWLDPIVSKSWERLAFLVRFERERRKDPHYYYDCEYLAAQCRRFDKLGRLRTSDATQRSDTVWLSDRAL